jgi:uncharacterized membrane protein (Fun14 family)
MSFENFSSIATTVGFGGITGFLIGYFIKRIVKILMFVFGAIFALLMYLQHQGMISVNMDKLQNFADGILTTVTGQIQITTMEHFGIPLSSSMTAGFVLGLRA